MDTNNSAAMSNNRQTVNPVGKLNSAIYLPLFPYLLTLDVIITGERIEEHIEDGHPGDYERYASHLSDMLADPDYIIEDKKPSTAIVLKQVIVNGLTVYLRLSLRILMPGEFRGHPDYRNSVLTFFHIHEREYLRLIKNKKVLYKRE